MTVQYVDPFGRFRWIRLMFLWKGGIFQVLWIELLAAMSIATIVISLAYAEIQNKPKDWILPAHLRTLSKIMAFIATRFQAAIGLMLGFYTATCYGRWTQVQQKEGDIQKIINKTSLRILYKTKEAIGKDGFTSDEIRNIRTELVRLLNLSHALAIGQVYEGTSKGSNQSLTYDSLLDSGLLKQKERVWFIDNELSHLRGIEYVAPLAWFQDNINNLVKQEAFQFNAFTAEEFGSTILALQEALDDLVLFVAEPVPLIYTQLVQVAVRLYLVLLLLDSILYDLAGCLRENSFGSFDDAGCFWEIIKYTFEYFLFVGWLTAATAMSNPFRCWSDEIDWVDRVKRSRERSQYTIGLEVVG